MTEHEIRAAVTALVRRWLKEERRAGKTWDAIAASLGVSKPAVHNIHTTSRGAGPDVESGFARVNYGGSVDALRKHARAEVESGALLISAGPVGPLELLPAWEDARAAAISRKWRWPYSIERATGV